MRGALEGLKVLDLTKVLAGPLCTMILGDMGADIIKVEPPGGDETRGWGPPHAGTEAAYYLGVNRNKRGIALDLAKAEGREILDHLIRRSDVLVENYKVGTLEKWGFGAAWRRENAPRLVHCSITGYGLTGPKAHLPGYDFVLQAECGLMSITGEADGGPTKHGVAVVDITTGLYAAAAILGALQARNASGCGQSVAVSLFESGLSLLANVAANHLVSGRPAARYGNGHPNIVPYRTFQTADGHLVLAVGNDGQFARFASLAGHPEWSADERLSTNAARVANRALTEKLVAEAVARRTSSWWVGQLRACGVPCGEVNDVAAALADPHAEARDMIQTVRHPTAGEIRVLGPPFKMESTPPGIHSPPPLFGQHTQEILAELGLDHGARARLLEARVAFAAPDLAAQNMQ
jgi:crotonobetainyl-CoA:carnitine CoA-transferase CaiB-like acyl-CoA transferase